MDTPSWKFASRVLAPPGKILPGPRGKWLNPARRTFLPLRVTRPVRHCQGKHSRGDGLFIGQYSVDSLSRSSWRRGSRAGREQSSESRRKIEGGGRCAEAGERSRALLITMFSALLASGRPSEEGHLRRSSCRRNINTQGRRAAATWPRE